jgi:hypothetical protein
LRQQHRGGAHILRARFQLERLRVFDGIRPFGKQVLGEDRSCKARLMQ